MSLVAIYLCLAGAILAEAIAIISFAASESLSSIISVVDFVAAFWLLSFPFA